MKNDSIARLAMLAFGVIIFFLLFILAALGINSFAIHP